MSFGQPNPFLSSPTFLTSGPQMGGTRRRPLFGGPMLAEGLQYDPSKIVPDSGAPYPMDERPMPSTGGIPPYRTPMGAELNIDPAAVTPKRPSIFAQGGIGRNIIGGFGDALSTWGGGQATFAQNQQMKQREAFERAEADRQRAAEFADWQRKAQWERDNPKPANNDTANDYEFYRQKFGQEFADNWLKFNAANVRQPDGTYVSAATGWGGGAPLSVLPPGITVDPLPIGGSKPKASSTFQPSVSNLWPHLNARESSSNYAAVGPDTRYGKAYGGNQLQVGTARDMAAKLKLPWRPDLLTDTSATGRAYQDALGQAYLQQGFDVTGNWRDALRYYHGGPDRRLWGPKTNKYADSILRSAGGL